MLSLVKCTSDEEINEIIKLQATLFDTTFIPFDYATSFINFKKGIAAGCYLRLIKKNNEIIGWIAAQPVKLSYCKYMVLNQLHYNCMLEGIEAIRCMKLAHEALINYAEAMKIPLVLSSSAHFDEKLLLVKLLEKQGWERNGYMAVWKTSHYVASPA